MPESTPFHEVPTTLQPSLRSLALGLRREWGAVLVFVLAALGIGTSPASADGGDYLARLVERAQRQHLAELPEWRALLHYRALPLSRGLESQVDDPSFFLAPDGKRNPQDELTATLESFFRSPGDNPDQSPQCRYPARYHWLSQSLGFERDRLPPVTCERFRHWFDEMNPGQLTLVFPAAYLNNPASMFGHTLFRVDPPGDDDRLPLLAETINYAADTRDQKGMAYAFKGLFGGYRGRFSIAPYYAAVKTYGDIENRDIWEYRLNLTGEEIAQLLRHVWELRTAWFQYYFLKENCSYHLLSLLEVARPELRLTGRFTGWTIPSETVRAVADAGLVREVRYRPSRNTVLQHRMRLMDGGEQQLAERLTRGVVPVDTAFLRDLPPVDQARVLELATDYLAYLQSPRFGAAQQNPGRLSELLLARSRLDVPDQTPAIAAPKVWPGAGHKPARVSLGFGIEDRREFVELAGGPAYHDTSDPEGGFTRGSRINLLLGALRYYPVKNQAEIERVDVIDIMSLSSWNRFMHPVSWKVAVGMERKERTNADRPPLGRVNAGAGISHDFSERTSAYAFGEGTVEMSDRFAYFVAPGLGARLGAAHDLTPQWRTEMHLAWQAFFLHEWRNDLEAVIGNRVAFGTGSIAGVDLEWKREFGKSFPGFKLYWQYYF